MWENIETIKTLIPLATPFVIVLLTFYLKHIYDKKERRYALRIEFSLDARVIGVQKGFYLVEFIATINNKSLIQKQFTAISLRVLGIKKEEDIGLWTTIVEENKTKEPNKISVKLFTLLGWLKEKKTKESRIVKTKRINFPEKILKESIIPPQWNYIFVEPGVKQELIYTTRIPEDISFILATVEFHYDATTPHTAERMFELKIPPSNNIRTIK